MIDEFIVQRGTSIVINSEGSSCQDLSLDYVKLNYFDILNQISYLVTRINPHMPMLLAPFKDVVLILLNFHVVFKIETLTFTRVIRGDKESLGLTFHVIHIIWYQEMVPQVTVGVPSIFSLWSDLT